MVLSERAGRRRRRHRRRRLHRARAGRAFPRDGAPFRGRRARAATPRRRRPPSASPSRDLADRCRRRARRAPRAARAPSSISPARVHVMRETATDPAAAYRAANVVATERLAQRRGACAASRASSSRARSRSTASRRLPGRPFRPDDPPAPQDAYARSKLDAERELGRLCAGTPLVPVILRLPLVYGPGVAGNFLALLDEIARGRALPLGAIRNRRSVLGTGNLVEAIDAALDAPVAPRGVAFRRRRRERRRARSRARDGRRARRRGAAARGPGGAAAARRRAVRPPRDASSASPNRSRSIPRRSRRPPAGRRGTRSRTDSRRPRAGGGCAMRSDVRPPRRYNRHDDERHAPSGRRADELRAAPHHPPLHAARRRLGADRGRRHARSSARRASRKACRRS